MAVGARVRACVRARVAAARIASPRSDRILPSSGGSICVVEPETATSRRLAIAEPAGEPAAQHAQRSEVVSVAPAFSHSTLSICSGPGEPVSCPRPWRLNIS
jgi:hypothetical protein